MHIARAQEEGAQELEGHVVQLHVEADHIRQLLYDGGLAPTLRRPAEKSCKRNRRRHRPVEHRR